MGPAAAADGAASGAVRGGATRYRLVPQTALPLALLRRGRLAGDVALQCLDSVDDVHCADTKAVRSAVIDKRGLVLKGWLLLLLLIMGAAVVVVMMMRSREGGVRGGGGVVGLMVVPIQQRTAVEVAAAAVGEAEIHRTNAQMLRPCREK